MLLLLLDIDEKLYLQAAYLVAISDPSSTAGRQGLVNQSQFAKAKEAIASAVEGLVDPKNNQQQVRRHRSCVKGQRS